MERSIAVNVASDAARAAASAAQAAGVEVVELKTPEGLAGAADLFATVWSAAEGMYPVTKDLLRALEHAGNYVTGAYAGGKMVAASVAFLGRTNGDENEHLHSHITGVLASHQGRRVGFAIKQHQRAWSLERGIGVVTWTFDPLVRRNAYFNLNKLGAEIVSYHANFYGPMADGVNFGDESDRCLASWTLDAEKTIEAANGNSPVASEDALRAEGATVLLEDAGGRPGVRGHAHGEDVALCWVPTDAVGIRSDDPARALEWRRSLRETFGDALDAGYAATAMTRNGWYVLRRRESR